MASRNHLSESGTRRISSRQEGDLCAGRHTALAEKMVPLQKEAQGGPAGSHHRASPALNTLNFPPVRPRLSKYIHPTCSCVISRVQPLHTGGSVWYCICPLP